MKSAITLAQNISRIRKENRLTQEDLATFLGVTKASVSKWETGQSYPDIELLPRIATYFGISIDELLGYEPQMSRQAIRIICAKLRKAFAEEPFEQAHDACKRLVRDYFSCYPLLVQIASLYLNHMNLASPEERDGLVAETFEICERVRNGGVSSVLTRQAEAIEAMLLLVEGKPQDVVDLLADAATPDMGADIILARAYSSVGQADRADATLQAMTYQALILSLNRLTDLAMLHAGDAERLAAIHNRTLRLVEAFDLESSFVNIAATHYAFAVAYVMGGDLDGALSCLEDYERSCKAIEFPIRLHGDSFFDRIDEWLDEMSDLGSSAPRDDAVVKRGVLASVVDNPVFAPLADDPRFGRIVAGLEEVAR